METKNKSFYLIVALVVLLLISLFFFNTLIDKDPDNDPGPNGDNGDTQEVKDIKYFSSEEEFKDYLDRAEELNEIYYHSSRNLERVANNDFGFPESMDGSKSAGVTPERYSETNIQVQGVDEPDIVKTDGYNIYFSIENPYYYFDIMRDPGVRKYTPPQENNKTKVIQSFPLEDMSLLSDIEKAGKLLLKDNILVIFEIDAIFGYDISDAKNPKEEWKIEFNERTRLTDARLYGDAIYLVTEYSVQSHKPCLIEPMIINDNPLIVDCTTIFRPEKIVPVDATYSVVSVDVFSGEVKNEISFVGSVANSNIYVSLENIYVTYLQHTHPFEFLVGFIGEEGKNFIDESVVDRIEKINQYDISMRAKMAELEFILEEYFASLSEDEQMRVENELTNRVDSYYNKNKRNLESTGVVRIEIDSLEIKASGSFPGFLLNQFSLDEYDGYLRVATTIGESNWMGLGTESANDIYVLDKELKEVGSVKNLGLGERVYSARFIGDKGYVVTFREIDPFYVLDLSDPKNPQMKGELKIPGYSSYLHPISDDKILGIGMEEWRVKVSLFDVTDPSDPKEIEKYILSEYWSEITSNHHAFLLDSKYEIFFLPGSEGAYIFSYKDNKINLVKTVSANQVKRALYIDDYLYIIASDNIIVLDQNNWERVKELNLTK